MSIFSDCLAKVSHARAEIGCPKRVLVALSGGADSVALFCVLKELAERERFSIAAVHVNHGLRETAARDEAFCRELCQRFQIPFFSKAIRLTGSSEDEARRMRYIALADVYKQWNADVLALAHHRADQAETVLLHLLRGSGSRGLCGMKLLTEYNAGSMRFRLFRPLLDEKKENLVHIAQTIADAYCEDESNQSNLYTRNFLRLHILPTINMRIPKAENAICRTAVILQAEDEYLDSVAHGFLASNACLLPPLHFLEIQPFLQQHLAMRRRIIQHFLPFAEDFETIDHAANMQPGSAVNLQKGWRLSASSTRIYLLPSQPDLPQIPQLAVLPYYGCHGDGIHFQAMPARLFKECVMRYREPGDSIHPFGMQGTKSLQDYLVDRKIDAPVRDYLPLLCKGKEVIWAIGAGVSEKARCSSHTDELVYLNYTAKLPYEKC